MNLDTIWTQVDALLNTHTNEERVIQFVCKSCNGIKVYGSDHMPVCSSCGIVDQYYIDETAEWTSGVSDEGKVSDPARCGNPNANPELFSEEWGKGTIIATKHTTYKNKRMSKINFHMSMNHKDRALFHAYKDIENAGQMLPQNVLQTAKILYKKFNDEKLTRGNVRLGIKGNCLLYACRLAQIPRTTKEIADMFNIQPKDISRTAQIFKQTIMGETEQNYVTKPINVLQRLLNAFDISRDERFRCVKMCTSLEKCPDLMSKTPNTIATAIIYINLASRFSKSEVASLCQVSIPTINKIEVIIKRYLEV
jgi:transcription initiation factor TFIIB